MFLQISNAIVSIRNILFLTFILPCYRTTVVANVNPIHNLFQPLKLIKDPNLLKLPSSNIIVTMNDPLSQIWHNHVKNVFPSRDDKISSLVNELQGFALQSQAPLLSLIKGITGTEAKPFWISNQLAIKNASPSLIKGLINSRLIKSIARDILFPIMPILNMTIGKPPDGPEWGIKKVNGDKLWNLTQGEGIIVGTIDTGARATHTALRNNWVGLKNHGWFDPFLYTDEPYDPVGHGTHTTATIAGDNGVGIAPKAKWIACKACDIFNCFPTMLLACGQFMLCPTDTEGNNKDCSKAPHIVSNSWGSNTGGLDDFYNPIITSWRAAGIIPFFAIGNEGPDCKSTNVPGNQKDVISVGATDANDHLAGFSSRGPGEDLAPVKPEILAPGQGINSAWFINDNSYRVLSGTSMATPIVAGAAALLLALNSTLKYDDIKNLLFETTFQGIALEEEERSMICGNISENNFPNHMLGHGRIDVYEAYTKMIEGSKYQRKETKLNTTSKSGQSSSPGITITIKLPKLI
ncbi:unnamed protein product [Orchesella dallaii]|uniref:Peptidase S8/S53 domain-containing protein n=1 Tax=Orchesella dallaii TaxID=48710 RepID=A0ABP1S412_9HEXA